ncbi:hypothetical protein [Arthrobacter sp. E44]|uniref:hypothetical protein n=1 Tax=Arthrobacter sp. E44 TaxID=3341794 RepID=UPI0035A6BB48
MTQSRTYLFAPDHAACTQPPNCTGAAGTPSPSKVTVLAVPPPNGCSNNADRVATATTSLPGPACCSLASRAFSNANFLPPGKNRFPAAASNTTGRSPTTVICKSPAPLRPSQALDSDDVTAPLASTPVTVTIPVFGSAE